MWRAGDLPLSMVDGVQGTFIRAIPSNMIKVLENLIDRVAALPKEAQEEVLRSVVAIEQRHTGVYRLDDEERADILAAPEEVRRGEVANDDEAAAVFRRLRDEGPL